MSILAEERSPTYLAAMERIRQEYRETSRQINRLRKSSAPRMELTEEEKREVLNSARILAAKHKHALATKIEAILLSKAFLLVASNFEIYCRVHLGFSSAKAYSLIRKLRDFRLFETGDYLHFRPLTEEAAKKKVRKPINEELRWRIFQRDGFRCFYCHKTTRLTVDHKKTLADGGDDSEENLITACRSCNSKKGRCSCDQEFYEKYKDTNA